ncbi:hypothetical protein PV08_01999 [Exophiala spinifera]|uniref:Uncharacterized protein n=1 Tax=Exophiala spinifera TaxID=91928 RepID=A0A0D2CD33_9EURO|nr:uncharacterized protein PV08_01999 [Exophiala spinifera]KIW21419.1 hypothetical protein PV08_01999 [Exophiala spinifera]
MSTAVDGFQAKFEHMERRRPIPAAIFCDESLVDALRKLDVDHEPATEASKSGKATFEPPETSCPAPPSALQIDSLPSTPIAGTIALQSDDTPGVDSGYASHASSNPGSREDSTSTKAGKFFGDFLTKSKTKLRPYDNDIPDTVRDRFLDLTELFNEPLLLHLGRKRLDVRSITIRLKCLGTDEHSAKPWIVVLCNPALAKEVRRYFNQKRVREELQPNDPDLPSLQVIVDSRPLMTTVNNEALDAFGECWDSIEEFGTLCGTPIKIMKDTEELYATIGGVIEVVGEDLTPRMFAMTVGHILADSAQETIIPGYTDTSEVDSAEDVCSVNSDFSDDALEEYEMDLSETDPSEEIVTEKAPHDFDLSTGHGDATKNEFSWSRFGKIISFHALTDEATGNFDWALIELDDEARYLPNKVLRQRHITITDLAFSADLVPRNKRTLSTEDHRLCLLNGRKHLQGVLSKEPTYVLLTPGTRMVEAFTIRLDKDKGVTKGDSGTWVVGVHNGLFYGHVIATDIFGDVYMVPSYGILRDIQDRLDAVRVSLPESSNELTFKSQEHFTEGKSIPVDPDVSSSFPAPLAMSEDHRPRAATCEDWDEAAQNTVPGSLITANMGVKRDQVLTFIGDGHPYPFVTTMTRNEPPFCVDLDEDAQTTLSGFRTRTDVSFGSDRDSLSGTRRKSYESDGVDSGYASKATSRNSSGRSGTPNLRVDVLGIRERERESYQSRPRKPPRRQSSQSKSSRPSSVFPPSPTTTRNPMPEDSRIPNPSPSYGYGAILSPGYTPSLPSPTYSAYAPPPPQFPGPYYPTAPQYFEPFTSLYQSVNSNRRPSNQPPVSYRTPVTRQDYSADSGMSPDRTLSGRLMVDPQKSSRNVDEDRARMPPPPPRRPVQLLDPDGRSRAEFGPINFNSAGLPPQIPQERPLVVKPEVKEEKKGEEKRGKIRKHRKSRGPRHAKDDGVMVGDDEVFHYGVERRKSLPLTSYDYRRLDEDKDWYGPRNLVSSPPGRAKTKTETSSSRLVPHRTPTPAISMDLEGLGEGYQGKASSASASLTAEALRAFDKRISSSKSETGSNSSRSSSRNSSERGESQTTDTKTSVTLPGTTTSITLPGGFRLAIPTGSTTRDNQTLTTRDHQTLTVSIGGLILSVGPPNEDKDSGNAEKGKRIERAPSVASRSSKKNDVSNLVSSRDTKQSREGSTRQTMLPE